tara:strand:+ start:409 stop:723 length:315 start_codon:yes stop_codon:yes gene_type:complete
LIVVTTDTIEGYHIKEVLGLVSANTVRARHVGKDIMAGFRSLVGGEVTEYAKLMAEAREQALSRLTTRAEALGADAVVGLRFTTSMIAQGSAEILAFGTAVKLS